MLGPIKVFQIIVVYVIKHTSQKLLLMIIKEVFIVIKRFLVKYVTNNIQLNLTWLIHVSTITTENKEKGNFPCPECAKEFSYKYGLNEHIKKEHSLNEVSCSTCDNVFKTASNLKRHNNDYHGPIERRKCSKCKKVLSSVSNLKKHLMTKHIEEDRIQFDQNNFMVLHTELNEEIVGCFICTFCRAKFTNKSDLENHLLRCKKRNKCIFVIILIQKNNKALWHT